MILAVVGFPLDLIKTRMQTSGASNGIFSTGLHIVRNEGVGSLYKGIAPPLISLTILNITTFTSYSYLHKRLNAHRGWDWRNAVAGGLCGPPSSTISTIENVVKTQMQVDNVSNHRFRGSMDFIRTLVKEKGFPALYTGIGVNTLRETTFISTYFFVYEGLRKELTTHVNQGGRLLSPQLAIPVAGGLSGAIAWTVSFPLDCIRAGVQGQELFGVARKGAIQVFRELIAHRGFLGLYAGVAPSIIRAFLVSGTRFSSYEFAVWCLRGGRDVEG
jgi:solute carrier family 25 carnitine/acylcarnitine transporter 20/29